MKQLDNLALIDLRFLEAEDPDYLDHCLDYALEPTPTGYALGLFEGSDGNTYTGASEDVDYLRMVQEFAENEGITDATIDPTKFTRFWEGRSPTLFPT